MGYKLPWSNFHELNLDWLLEKMKELEEKVDSFIGSAVPSNDPPEMDGAASAGSSINYARGDHVHPTDTSRASQDDLNALSGQLDYEVGELASSIDSVDAKISFSSAAPAMDGVASPGSSTDQARADHVHPTDTSRASQDDLDALQAVVDGYVGGATPSDTAPNMDGVAAAGVSNTYSRGDHVHPHDTSKLDKAGGIISGDLEVRGNLTEAKKTGLTSVNAIGWIRIANVPYAAGSMVTVNISRKGTLTPAELHRITMTIDDDVTFEDELSNSSDHIIDKIRYTSGGYIDIHVDQVYNSMLRIDIEPHTTASPVNISIGNLNAVADSPDGESVVTEYSFHATCKYVNKLEVNRINGVGFAQDSLSVDTPKTVLISPGRYMLFIGSYNAANVGIWAVNCTSAGVVTTFKLGAAAAGAITLEPGTNSLTITSANRTATYTLMYIGSN